MKSKRRLNIWLNVLLLLSLTLLLVYDYFPDIEIFHFIPIKYINWIFIAGVLSCLVLNRQNQTMTKKSIYKDLYLFYYIVVFIVIMTLLGGNTNSGIGFNTFSFWIITIIFFWNIIYNHKKIYKRISIRFVSIASVTLLTIFSFNYWNEHREKSLADIIQFHPSDYALLGFTKNQISENQTYEWWTESKRPANQLIKFLSQYHVKRVREEEFQKAEDGEKFEFTISHFSLIPAIVTVKKDYIHILMGNYYKVINGPIDMSWVNDFNHKYQKQFGK
ncbi:hypothetical protein J6TS2_44350 [Heyndrickxia sporothermodurans]|nr:hypothetical protein J6TS2_44350 [Heyndrickxia sporothermodurans]